jgi:hypothetical protein
MARCLLFCEELAMRGPRTAESTGEWIYRFMRWNIQIEEEAWALERVKRVMGRLCAGRMEKPFIVIIPWLQWMSAFTTPDRYIFFSRRLFEQCRTDEEVAFVLAHEIAHHELGHLDVFKHVEARIHPLPKNEITTTLLYHLVRRLYGPENECAADRHAIDLCRAAGYDGLKCIEIFDALEDHALDMGDHDGVYGPNAGSDDELDENASWKTKAQIWIWQRKRGYLPIRDRRQMLRKYVARLSAQVANGLGVQ